MGILAKEGNSFYKGKFFLGFIRYEMHLRNEIQTIHILNFLYKIIILFLLDYRYSTSYNMANSL